MESCERPETSLTTTTYAAIVSRRRSHAPNRAWHRGLDNNCPRILAARCVYQLLVRYNHRRGNKNGQITWTVDSV